MRKNLWKERVCVTLISALEYYDIAIYAAISPYILQLFFPESIFGTHASFYVWGACGLRLLSRPLGGFYVSLYVHKKGKHKALLLTCLITGCATLVLALLPTYQQIGLWAPLIFFLMQLAQAFSFGGESPTALTYLMEKSNSKEHARVGGLLWGTNLIAVIASLSVVYVLESYLTASEMLDYGWRIPFFFGVLNIGLSSYFRVKFLRPVLSQSKVSFVSFNASLMLKVFFITIPTVLIVYSNTFSISMLLDQSLDDPMLKKLLPIVINILFMLSAWLAGWWIDTHSSCSQTLKWIYGSLIILGVPVYFLQSLNSLVALFCSYIYLVLLVGVTLSATPSLLYQQIQTHSHHFPSLALGYNLSVAILGGITPLLVHVLVQYHIAYVGVVMSFGGLCFFYALSSFAQVGKLSEMNFIWKIKSAT
tara:strand:+ start:3458 stop:4720 length:1263 start_codon:yes stop_codon:yes gene_type:complete